jgi:outer membrane protein assembly factor BamB
MKMKRTSFVCFGAQGSKDSLVYQEIPGRDGGEEFFLFFSPGESDQEPVLRTLFREAVSTSRLGAPIHYFSQFLERFEALAARAPADGGALGGALIMIQIRRGDEVHMLCSRDSALVHWDGSGAWQNPFESLRGFSEIPLGNSIEQRDLFQRTAEDFFVLYRFTLGEGAHTLIVAPSDDFLSQHAESLRNSVFFPAFEFPRETGIELAVSRSFPALHWNGGEMEECAAVEERIISSARRLNTPLIAGILAAIVVVALAFGAVMRHKEPGAAKEPKKLLDAADADRSGPTAPAEVKGGARIALSEAWKREFSAPVTSSPRFHDGKIFFGCRDGFVYAFTPEGEQIWKYRSAAGIGASPCCLGERVICANYRGEVMCLEASTGKQLWSLSLRSKIVSTPAAFENMLVVGTTDGRMIAVRLKDAKKLWEKKLGASVWGSPTVGEDYIIATTTDGSIFRLDHRGGVIWKAKAGGGIASSPLCMEDLDLVVFGARDGAVHAYALSNGVRRWRLAVGSAIDGSPARGPNSIILGAKSGTLSSLTFDGKLLWQCDVGGAVYSKPLIASGAIFVTTYASRLVALDPANGRILGEYRAASPLYSSPVDDGKRVYFGSNGGVFHAVWLRPPAAA